jgi:hypothetical protein
VLRLRCGVSSQAGNLPSRRCVAIGLAAAVTMPLALPLPLLADGGHPVEPIPSSPAPNARSSYTEHDLDADIGHLFNFLMANESKVVDLDLRLAVDGSRNGSNHHLHKNNRNMINHNYHDLDWIVMSYTRRNMRARLIVYHSRERNLPPGYFGFRGPFEVQNEYEFEFADFDINRLPKGYKGFYLSPAGYTAPR